MTIELNVERKWKEIGEAPKPNDALKSGDHLAALNGFAMEHFLRLRDSRSMTTDASIINFGATLWLLGDPHGATRIWARVCDEAIKGRFSHSGDGTFKGGLLLWFASAWLQKSVGTPAGYEQTGVLAENMRDLANDLLDKLIGKKGPITGAGIAMSIAKYLRGEIDLAKIEAEYSEVELFAERQRSMVKFYAGVKAIEDNNGKEALRLWSQVGKPKNSLVEIEYYLLVAERNRLKSC